MDKQELRQQVSQAEKQRDILLAFVNNLLDKTNDLVYRETIPDDLVRFIEFIGVEGSHTIDKCFEYQKIRLRDGKLAKFAGYTEEGWRLYEIEGQIVEAYDLRGLFWEYTENPPKERPALRSFLSSAKRSLSANHPNSDRSKQTKTFRLDADLLETLETRSQASGKTQTEIVEMALKRFIES